jgi:hypothetical protein
MKFKDSGTFSAGVLSISLFKKADAPGKKLFSGDYGRPTADSPGPLAGL